MELTEEQIRQVETYLDKKNFDFIDLKVEVLDHMVSDIESFLVNNYSFENAFKITVLKWNPQLKESSSWLFGIGYAAPKPIIRKAKKSFLKWYILLTIFGITLFLLLDKVNLILPKNIIDSFNLSFQIMTILCSLFFTYFLLTEAKNKTKTTYSFILNTQKLNYLFGVFLFLDFKFINKQGLVNNYQTGFLFIYILTAVTYFYFLKKHKEAIKKYKIL
jgi:hypothetical protein